MDVNRDSILTLELPYRERAEIRRTSFRAGDGPRLAVVSGVHGDELEGLYVCQQLAAWLERAERERPGTLRGCIEIYPALNPIGVDSLQRFVPVFDTDLNRSFPGREDGLLPQRIAAAAMRSLAGADLVFDVHASNIFLREIPQVRINQEFASTLVPLAEDANIDVIWIHGALTVLEATIAHSLNAAGTPCLVVEMGVGMRVTPTFTEQLLVGVLHLARRLGVLAPDVELPERTHVAITADDDNVVYLNADTSGLFIPEVEHWKSVREGQLLGRIVSPNHGDVVADVVSPVDGVLFTLREYPVVYEGSLMARIVRR
jgi:predicted deacylase